MKPPETPPVYQASQNLALPSPFPQPLGDYSCRFISETQIRRGDTLAALLQRLRVQERGLQPFLVQRSNKLEAEKRVAACLGEDQPGKRLNL